METAAQPETTEFDAARLIEEHQTGIWRYLRALGCDSSQADDLTQETFLAVLQRPFQDYGRASTVAYLRTVARNQFISAYRRSGKMVAVENIEAFDRTWEGWAGADNGEAMTEALKECLQHLSARARMALDMRFRDRESRLNIAAALKISEHGAKNLMQRAKQRLRECIEGKLQ